MGEYGGGTSAVLLHGFAAAAAADAVNPNEARQPAETILLLNNTAPERLLTEAARACVFVRPFLPHAAATASTSLCRSCCLNECVTFTALVKKNASRLHSHRRAAVIKAQSDAAKPSPGTFAAHVKIVREFSQILK